MAPFTIDLGIAFASDPLDNTPTFTTIDPADILSISVNRGRSSLLDQWSTSNCTIVLKNTSRAYDPFNTAGAYYGQLLANKQVRVRAVTSGGTRNVWYGYVDSYDQGFMVGDHMQTCTIRCSDAFKLLAQIKVSGTATWSQQDASARVSAILDSAKVAWPAALRAISTTPATILSADDRSDPTSDRYDASRTISDALLEVDRTEQGLLFAATTGTISFISRNDLATNTIYTTPQLTFDDDGTDIPYRNISLRHADNLIRNEVIVSHGFNSWTPQSADDATSQATYGYRSQALTTLDVAATAAHSTAENLVRYFKDPQPEARIEIAAHRSETICDTLLASLGYGWLIRLNRRPRTGAVITQDYWIRQITHNVPSNREWNITVDLIPARPAESWWIWGTSVWGTGEWAW